MEDRSDSPSTAWLEGTSREPSSGPARRPNQRFPAFIPRVIRAFEPMLRQSAAWPGVLKIMNLA